MSELEKSDKKEKALDIILKNVDDKDFTVALQKANEFFKEVFYGHSAHQIHNFILNDRDFPMPDDKYYQAMMEAHVRFDELLGISFKIKRLDCDIELKSIDLEELSNKNGDGNTYDIRRREIQKQMLQDDARQLIFEKESVQKRFSSLLREMGEFVKAVEFYRGKKQFNSYDEKEQKSWEIRARSLKGALPLNAQYREKKELPQGDN